jgi:sugar O-acyltransferase (sialic acid O-acetyltransferase NeuD family)
MKNIVLIGGGNQVQYSIDIIEKQNIYNIIGIIDSKQEIGSTIYKHKIIGRQESLLELIEKYNIKGGLITIGDNYSRYCVHNIIERIKPDFEFINAIHPSVVIGNNVTLGTGILAMAGCIFNPGAYIGNFTFFATGAHVEHDCYISDYSSISAGSLTGGHVKLGRFSALTLGVTAVDRIEIGENTVVGAGSVVLKSLPDNVLAYGNPAKVIRGRELKEKFLK